MSDEHSSTILTLITVCNLSTDHGRNCNAFPGRRPSLLCCVGRVSIQPAIDDRPVVPIDTPQFHDAEIKDNGVGHSRTRDSCQVRFVSSGDGGAFAASPSRAVVIGREALSGVDPEVCPTEEMQLVLEFIKLTLDHSAQPLCCNITKLPCDPSWAIPATVELHFTSDDGSLMKARSLAGR